MTCRAHNRRGRLSAMTAQSFLIACILALCSITASAIEVMTDYEYDDLYRLTKVTYKAAVWGKPPRTLYTTTYSYDKNGNRITMDRVPAPPEIDGIEELDRDGTTIRFKVRGIGFQVGMMITLTLGDGTQVTGTVTQLNPSGAIVEFLYSGWPPGITRITVLNPDGEMSTASFLRRQYNLSIDYIVGVGEVDISPSPPHYLNDEVTLTAQQIPGGEEYVFDRWEGDLTGSQNPAPVEMNADKRIAVYFKDIVAPRLILSEPLPAVAMSGSAEYTVDYSGADAIVLDPSDVTLHKMGAANGMVGAVTGTGNLSRTVRVDNISGIGKLAVSITPGTASDASGNQALGAGPSPRLTVGDLKWVDFTAAPGGDGTEATPFNRLEDAIDALMPWGTIKILPGESNETLRIAKSMWIEQNSGLVRVGVIGAPTPVSAIATDGASSINGIETGDNTELERLIETLREAFGEFQSGNSGATDSDESTAENSESNEAPDNMIYEKVIPFTKTSDGTLSAQADSPLAIRLRSKTGIDPDSIWGPLPNDLRDKASVEWHSVVDGDMRDIWVVFKPTETWPLEEFIELTAGAEANTGEPTVSGPHTFRVESRVTGVEPQQSASAASPQLDEPDGTVLVSPTSVESVSPGEGVTQPFAIEPERIYEHPQRVWLPIPQGASPADVRVYYYHRAEERSGWYPADVIAGWLVPNSYVVTEQEGTRYLGFLVRHAGIVQLGITGGDTD